MYSLTVEEHLLQICLLVNRFDLLCENYYSFQIEDSTKQAAEYISKTARILVKLQL